MVVRLAALALLSLASAPAFALGVDVRTEAIAALKARDKNPAAAEAAAFLEKYPEIKVIMATPAELRSDKYEQIAGAYDFKYDTIFLIEAPKEGLDVRDAAGKVSQIKLGLFLDVRAPTIVHEASHASVVKKFRYPVAGIIQDELLAHVRQARYLEKEFEVSPELSRAVDTYRRILMLEAQGGSPLLPHLRERYEQDKAELTMTAIHLALVLKEYRSGPRAFARYLRLRYGPTKGFWSVFGRPAPAIARLQTTLDEALTETARESAYIQIGFWNDKKRLGEFRKFYAEQLPEYRDMRWPQQE